MLHYYAALSTMYRVVIKIQLILFEFITDL